MTHSDPLKSLKYFYTARWILYTPNLISIGCQVFVSTYGLLDLYQGQDDFLRSQEAPENSMVKGTNKTLNQ